MFLLVGTGKLPSGRARPERVAGVVALMSAGGELPRQLSEGGRFWDQGRAWHRELWKLPHIFHMQNGEFARGGGPPS